MSNPITLLAAAHSALPNVPGNGELMRQIALIQEGQGVSVTDFSDTVGNGVDSDTDTVQAAVDAAISRGGGRTTSVYFPPGRSYRIGGSGVQIKSRSPVWLVSEMAGGIGGTNIVTDSATIAPHSSLSGSMFTWDFVDGESNIANTGGGGIRGLRIIDYVSDFRNVSCTSAIYVKAAALFAVDSCVIAGIVGSAIKGDNCVSLSVRNRTYIQRCGNTSKPALMIGNGTDFCALYLSDSFVETCYSEAYVSVAAASTAQMSGGYFEADSGTAASNQKFVLNTATSPVGLRGCAFNANTGQKIDLKAEYDLMENCTLDGAPSSNVATITMSGAYSAIRGGTIICGASQTGNCVTLSGLYNRISGVTMVATGAVQLANSYGAAENLIMVASTAQGAYVITGTAGCRITNNTINSVAHASPTAITGTDTGVVITGNVIDNITSGVAISTTDKYCVVANNYTGQLNVIATAFDLKMPYRLSSTTSEAGQNATITIAEILGGRITHATNTAGGTVTTDTAANIIAGDGFVRRLANTGDYFECHYINTGDQTATFAGGDSVTISDTGNTVLTNESALLRFIRTSATTVTMDVIN